MNALDFAKALGDHAYDHGVYDQVYGDDIDVLSVTTFNEAGLLTDNDGIVVKLRDGSEFQVTVVQSQYADVDEDEEVAS